MATDTRDDVRTDAEQRDALVYEAFADRSSPDDWRVEGIDHASEGRCYVTIFSGPGAEERAREYAAWMNSRAQVR